MSSPPQETETRDVELTRDERWIVHHALCSRADDAIDSGETPPDWLVDVFESIEDGDETFTRTQAGRLHDLLTEYLSDAPERDLETALDAADRIDAAFGPR